jgi:adenosylhomocysteine nucleosidase
LSALALLVARPALADPSRIDPFPRTAVISAFEPELAALAQATANKRTYADGGFTFTTGMLEGQPVVLFLSGISMVNAAMTTQAALDRFAITRIVFSGIAGGVDPGLAVGDVVVPERWAQYQESVMARETAPGAFAPPAGEPLGRAHFGMMYPKAVAVSRPAGLEHKPWFAADPGLLAVARGAAQGLVLKRCAANLCLKDPPKVVVGGAGVSGQAFVDNAKLRGWLYASFGAQVLDMESAAVAQVAYVNDKPFVAFRSLSDLAGGDPGKNQARVFFRLAADNSATVVRAFLKALP